jgi:hypothetical protein
MAMEDIREQSMDQNQAQASASPAFGRPELADFAAERTLLSTLRAGFGVAADIEGLGGEHFVDKRCGMLFELEASAIRGGKVFSRETKISTMAKASGRHPDTILVWLDRLDAEWPVQLYPSVAEQALRIRSISAWRRFFEHVRFLEVDTSFAAARGLELGAAPRLRRMLDNLNADLGRKNS